MCVTLFVLEFDVFELDGHIHSAMKLESECTFFPALRIFDVGDGLAV
jgi:hypothetical protein